MEMNTFTPAPSATTLARLRHRKAAQGRLHDAFRLFQEAGARVEFRPPTRARPGMLRVRFAVRPSNPNVPAWDDGYDIPVAMIAAEEKTEA